MYTYAQYNIHTSFTWSQLANVAKIRGRFSHGSCRSEPRESTNRQRHPFAHPPDVRVVRFGEDDHPEKEEKTN